MGGRTSDFFNETVTIQLGNKNFLLDSTVPVPASKKIVSVQEEWLDLCWLTLYCAYCYIFNKI
jgi:hypothetical protein